MRHANSQGLRQMGGRANRAACKRAGTGQHASGPAQGSMQAGKWLAKHAGIGLPSTPILPRTLHESQGSIWSTLCLFGRGAEASSDSSSVGVGESKTVGVGRKLRRTPTLSGSRRTPTLPARTGMPSSKLNTSMSVSSMLFWTSGLKNIRVSRAVTDAGLASPGSGAAGSG